MKTTRLWTGNEESFVSFADWFYGSLMPFPHGIWALIELAEFDLEVIDN